MAFFECLVGGSGDGSTLTVTCYSGFAGLTISITNGVDTFSDVCPSTSPYEVVFDGLVNGTWTLSTVYNGVTYTETVEVNSTSQFYPIPNGETTTPTDDIQTWLYCASIFDKNYTSIAQVLADASTLQALIASNNAADYMARSTTWASDVCSDANAMTYIGANDYCAEDLLSDSTWLVAICNSAYFESVLNVKVPTMISNTAPYGEVIFSGSNYVQLYPYMAFDGADDENTRWASQGTNFGSPCYLGYHFTSLVKLDAVKIKFIAGITSSTCQIQGSNTGNTNDWHDIGEVITVGALDDSLKPIKSLQAYQYYRVYISNQTQTTSRTFSGQVQVLQFYGRA